jgi:hypothetical protein
MMKRPLPASRLFWLLTVAAFLCLSCYRNAHACWVTLSTVRVSPSFRVLVEHGTVPVAGVRVLVYDYRELEKSHGEGDWKPILNTVSDANGAVQVENLGPGRYLVETKGAGSGSAVDAVVSRKGPKSNNQLTLEWPATWKGILKVRALEGRLSANDPWVPFETLHLELWDAGAQTPLAVEEAGKEGRFHFDEAQPGIYILRIRGHQQGVDANWQVEGEIPFELSLSAPESPDPVSLDLAMTSCGLTYSNCSLPNVVALSSRRIRLVDPLGADIARAKYKLLAATGATVAEGSTDSDGAADLPPELQGRFTLVVHRLGFTRLNQPLELLAVENGARTLRVSMTLHGSDQCSSVSLEGHAAPQ